MQKERKAELGENAADLGSSDGKQFSCHVVSATMQTSPRSLREGPERALGAQEDGGETPHRQEEERDPWV